MTMKRFSSSAYEANSQFVAFCNDNNIEWEKVFPSLKKKEVKHANCLQERIEINRLHAFNKADHHQTYFFLLPFLSGHYYHWRVCFTIKE